MKTSEENIKRLLEMLDNPSAYSEQEISDIINRDDETREAYRLMVAAKQGYRRKNTSEEADAEAAWQRLSNRLDVRADKPSSSGILYKIAASFIVVLMLSGIALAAYHVLPQRQDTEAIKEPEPRMLGAFFVPKDCKNPRLKERGDAILARWTKGTWVQNGADSFIEEHKDGGYSFHLKAYGHRSIVKLDGKELDIHNLPDLPASALKKVEIHREDNDMVVNLITTPVQIPADVKGNVNPELTILLTGTVPKGAYQPVTIWQSKGIKDSYDWHDYIYTSWTGQWENVRIHLKEAVNRKDHHVRINVCKGTPQKHIDRIKSFMKECDVTNYEIVQQ